MSVISPPRPIPSSLLDYDSCHEVKSRRKTIEDACELLKCDKKAGQWNIYIMVQECKL